MKTNKQEVSKKLLIAEEKLVATNDRVADLIGKLSAINEAMESAKAEQKYLRARIKKLRDMLEG